MLILMNCERPYASHGAKRTDDDDDELWTQNEAKRERRNVK